MFYTVENKIASSKSVFVVLDVLLQEITHSGFKVCVKDSQGLSNSHNPITVHYIVIGGIPFVINIDLVLRCFFFVFVVIYLLLFFCCCEKNCCLKGCSSLRPKNVSLVRRNETQYFKCSVL